jgi:hypothetical protein
VQRLFDVGCKGLHLGIARVSVTEAEAILSKEWSSGGRITEKGNTVPSSAVIEFIEDELERLSELRSILSGLTRAENIEKIIDDCDYLWAHFPECAGTGGQRPATADLSFLKRVRAEIDPFMKAFQLAKSELESGMPHA